MWGGVGRGGGCVGAARAGKRDCRAGFLELMNMTKLTCPDHYDVMYLLSSSHKITTVNIG